MRSLFPVVIALAATACGAAAKLRPSGAGASSSSFTTSAASTASTGSSTSSPAALPPFGSVVTLDNTAQQVSLRHCYWQAFATPQDGTDDFHWVLSTALNGAGQQGAVSLQSLNYPGFFLVPSTLGDEPARLLAIQNPPNADDASFSFAPSPSNASQFVFASLSKNASYAGLIISQVPALTGTCANRWSAPSGDVILAAPGAAGASQEWAVSPLPPPPPAVLTVNVTGVDHVIPSRFLGCHADPGYVQSPLAFTPSMLYGNSFEGAGDESSVYAWNNVSSQGSVGAAALDNATQVNPSCPAPSLKVTFTSSAADADALPYVGWSNRGIGNEGLAWTAGFPYTALAVVLAPQGATLYFGAHDRTAGTVTAGTAVPVPASGAWQVVNVSLTPATDATCVGVPYGDTADVSCTTSAGDGGSGNFTNPGQVCVRCDGEYVVGLAAPGTAWIGFTDFRPGPWGTFGPRGLAQLRTVQALQTMGISTIRQGGTVSQTFAWKEWRGTVWERAAMQHYWETRLIPSTWGPFEFVETANAAGIEPILTFAYDLNSADDFADLVEYCWGNASTAWGSVRVFNDSHPEPYAVTTFELGNEQQNPNFVDQVAAMEARAVAVGAPPLRYVYPDGGGIPASVQQGILALGGPSLAARTMPDIHIWGSQGGVATAQSEANASPSYPSSFVNMEINARQSTLVRGVNEAADLQAWFNVGPPLLDRLVTRTTSFCIERSGHFDGYDEGLSFFLPNATWLQPPGEVHKMVASSLSKARNALQASVSGPDDPSWLAASAQVADDGSVMVVQLVNQASNGQPGEVTITLAGTGFTPSGAVVVSTLSDPAAAAGSGVPNPFAGNTPWQPDYISPKPLYLQWPQGSSSWTISVPASSFWVLEVYGSGRIGAE